MTDRMLKKLYYNKNNEEISPSKNPLATPKLTTRTSAKFQMLPFSNTEDLKKVHKTQKKQSREDHHLISRVQTKIHTHTNFQCSKNGCFQKLGAPQNGWFIMQKPYFLMDDLGGKPTIFRKHPNPHQKPQDVLRGWPAQRPFGVARRGRFFTPGLWYPCGRKSATATQGIRENSNG